VNKGHLGKYLKDMPYKKNNSLPNKKDPREDVNSTEQIHEVVHTIL